MTTRSHRTLLGILATGALTLPLLTAAFGEAAKKPAAAAAGDAKAGKVAFAKDKEGCAGCHKTKDFTDASATVGPDLSAYGKSGKTFAQCVTKIMKPGANSVMPALKDKKVAENITAYLMTQK